MVLWLLVAAACYTNITLGANRNNGSARTVEGVLTMKKREFNELTTEEKIKVVLVFFSVYLTTAEFLTVCLFIILALFGAV